MNNRLVNNLSLKIDIFSVESGRQVWTNCDIICKCKTMDNYEVKLMSHTFKGGVHPNYMKRPDIPATVIAPPAQVVIPIIHHIGAPCKPLVEKGDYVKM